MDDCMQFKTGKTSKSRVGDVIICVRRTNAASLYEFSIGFWNCSDSVVFFVVHFIL